MVVAFRSGEAVDRDRPISSDGDFAYGLLVRKCLADSDVFLRGADVDDGVLVALDCRDNPDALAEHLTSDSQHLVDLGGLVQVRFPDDRPHCTDQLEAAQTPRARVASRGPNLAAWQSDWCVKRHSLLRQRIRRVTPAA